MEEWQKEITYHKPLFFKAKLTAKYCGELNNYLTEKDAQHREHFRLSYFYDIELIEIDDIKEKEYELTEKSFDIVNHDTIVGEYKGEQFALNPLELFVLKGVKPDHIQYEDDGIHGHFVNVPIVFKVLKPKKKIICIEGAVTKRETLEDGSIVVTKIVDSETCATEIFTIPPKESCVEGAWTGEKRINDGWVEHELTRSDCSKYWKKMEEVVTAPVAPTECTPGFTGKTRKKDGWIQKEYTSRNCNTYWVNHQIPVSCWEVVGYILLAILILLVLGILLYHNQLHVLGFILLIGAGIIGVSYLVQYLSRFSAFFVSLFRVLLNLALVGGLILLLYGLIQFFKTDHTEKKRKELIENRSEDKKRVSPPRPVPRPKQEKESVEDTEIPLEVEVDESEVVDSIEQIEINLQWRALDGELYQGAYSLNVPDIKKSQSYIRSFTPYNFSSFGALYGNLSSHDHPKMGSLYEMLDSIKTENKLSDRRFLDVIVSMVQSQEYVIVLDVSCSDPKILSDRSIRNMLNSGVSCESSHPFGLKSPLEFLSSLTGDCDTRTLLLYTLLKHYGYKVAIINSTHYAHSMIGVDIDGARGSRKVYRRNNYYFWETTSKGFELGFLPHEVNSIVFWDVVLN